jgi:hypothetical protein
MVDPDITSEVEETWRPVVGYEGLYSVSSLGRVRTEGHGLGRRAGRILAQSPARGGYMKVGLCRNNRARTVHVHRLVADAFHGMRPESKNVNHKNGVRTDNRAANLEWLTQRENLIHSRDVLGSRFGRANRGSENGNAKVSESDVLQIRRRVAAGERCREVAETYGLAAANVAAIARGDTWVDVGGPRTRGTNGRRHKKLTAENAREIRRLCLLGVSQYEIARRFQITQQTVSDIHVGRRWGHIM